ncbi:hypothetical protein [Actinocatenispora sera]|uniref:Uncharacterized protein n=1 Tax=Actinocatenispora sera TaxID=390989 RepID=A0A810KYF7_9ACTN|nr:hypothetical protein [Actinocatenispora sera]BCJ27937.1 hypothetical protein Asera_20450 [Actinocatenispora sera]
MASLAARIAKAAARAAINGARNQYAKHGTESMSMGQYRDIVTTLGEGNFKRGLADLKKIPAAQRRRMGL